MKNIFLLFTVLFVACSSPSGEETVAGSSAVNDAATTNEVLQKMVKYKNLDASSDRVHKKAKGFLRLEFPETPDNWADMMVIHDESTVPVVVYLTSECEPNCDQNLKIYRYVDNLFKDVTKDVLPQDLKSTYLSGSGKISDDPRNLGYRFHSETGNIELIIYRTNDETIYNNMEVRGKVVGTLKWNGKRYEIS